MDNKHLQTFCETHVRYVKLFKMIISRIKHYHEDNDLVKTMADLTLNKKFRRRNFPEDISETMVRFILWRKSGVMPVQNKTGDLLHLGKNVEVKTFISNGPSSFGPTETWDVIYFFDLSKAENNSKTRITLYKVPLKMESPDWQKIKVNKSETMGDQQRSKRRPRIEFAKIQKQLAPHHVCVEYDGYFEDLL